jgi:hypothetical protein
VVEPFGVQDTDGQGTEVGQTACLGVDALRARLIGTATNLRYSALLAG